MSWILAALVSTVSISDFSVGRKWHWNYFDSHDQIYSSEQYEVISNNGGKILIEMSSRLPGQTDFHPHHRIEAALADCLNSYRNPVDRQPWSMRMFHLEGSQWIEIEPPSPLAFEEKFNCNPYRHDSSEYLTLVKDSPVGEIFSHLRWRRIEGSWYFNSGMNSGVVYEKDFPHSAGGETYHMRMDMDAPLSRGFEI